MYTFHVTIHALPDAAKPGAAMTIAGQAIAPLEAPAAVLSTPLSISFEDVAERLGHLPRSCVEPDGSFCFGSAQGQPQWQVDGNLFDRNGRLLFVDLKGSCPPVEFDRILSALGWPETQLAFQLVREAVLLGEAEFRRWACQAAKPDVRAAPPRERPV